MLTQLTIENYALIDKSVINFSDGFTVITGETGAGKSIMLDALSLLMGSRADAKAMGSKDRKLMVEAIFQNPDSDLQNVCEENGIDWDSSEIILRREMSPSGKSRSFINDTPVNLKVLAEISEKLIDIHSQHSNSLLNNPQQQLSIIDAYAGNENIRLSYKDTFKKYVGLRNQIKKIKEGIAQGKENLDFLNFRLEQLDKIKPKKGELAMLEREAEILGDADRIKSSLSEAQYMLEGENSALKSLQLATSVIDNIDFNLLDPDSNDNISERLNSLKIELRDITDTIESYSENIVSDPQRYEKIQSRIESLYDIMKRLKVRDEEELVNLYEQLKKEKESITGDGVDIKELENKLKELAKELKEHADSLSESRKEAADTFSSEIMDRIKPLGLPNIRFDVEIEKGKLTSEGQDIVSFNCSFNKNHAMQPISQIASGGEISRVMLGIKSLMTENMNLPTIIFDEIDTGVSGEIAHKMGSMMKEMSSKIQVMSVTHLPQVAVHGKSHLKVYKADDNEKTISHIKKLDLEEREIEIAGMLSGNSINEVALENARMLLKSV